MDLFIVFFIAMTIAACAIFLLVRFTDRLGFEDAPSERKIHDTPIPRAGGAGIVLGTLLAVATTISAVEHAYFFASAIVIFLFGLWDDRTDLDFRLKFLGQIVAAAGLVVGGGLKITQLPLIGLNPLPDLVAIPLTIIALIAVTNAINLADGLDGLAGGMAFLSFGGIAMIAFLGGLPFVFTVSIAMMGALTGFLRFNTYPAVIFMGDGGSQFLGFILGALSIMLTQSEFVPVSELLPLFLIGLPVLDTLFVMTHRLRAGRSPFEADNNHIHHRLLNNGFEHYQAVALIYAIQALFVYAAFLLRFETDWLIAASYVLLATVIGVALHHPQVWRRETTLPPRASAPERSLVARWVLGGLVTALLIFVMAATSCASRTDNELRLWALLLLLGSMAWIWWRRERPLSGLERGFMYVMVTTLFYVSQSSSARSAENALLWDIFFVILGALVVLGLRFRNPKRLRLTPLDFLVGCVALAMPLLPGTGNPMFGLLLAKLCVLFYASEIILANFGGRAELVRAAAALAAGSLGLRMLI